MRRLSRDEQVALRPVSSRVPESLVEGCVKGDRVERHLDVHPGGELGAHAAHAFARRAFALMRLSLEDQHIAAAALGEMVGDAGADDSSPDDDDICRLQCFPRVYLSSVEMLES